MFGFSPNNLLFYRSAYGLYKSRIDFAIKRRQPSEKLKLPKPFAPKVSACWCLNLSTLIIPGKWLTGRVFQRNPVNQGESYHPITLLFPIVNTLEALLLPFFTKHLTPATHQHGFRKVHSTTTALTPINMRVNRGLNQNRSCRRSVGSIEDFRHSQPFRVTR